MGRQFTDAANTLAESADGNNGALPAYTVWNLRAEYATRTWKAFAGIDKPPVIVKVEPPQAVIWNGETLQQPRMWRVSFVSPQRAFNAEYWAGNVFVTVKRQDPNLLSLLMRLHMGNGVNAAWVLLVDTLAGGLIALALAGTLLWSRLHGTRLLAGALRFGSLGLMLWFAWYSF